MKALTVRQPYASLIAAGVKTIVTRPRPVGYRGRVAIHAAKEKAHPNDPGWAPLLEPKSVRIAFPYRPLPLGAVVASAVITDCVPIVDDSVVPDERHVFVHHHSRVLYLSALGAGGTRLDAQLPFGDFSPGRWALLLDDIAPTTDRCPACWGQRFPECPNGCGCRTFEDPDRRDCGCDGPCTGATEELDAVWRIRWCPDCEGVGTCDPVPVRGRSGLWEWTP